MTHRVDFILPLPDDPAMSIFRCLIVLTCLLGATVHAEPPRSTQDRIQELKRLILKQPKAGQSYLPAVEGNLEAADAPVLDILKQLPGVIAVEMPIQVERPKHRIVHLKDWHYLPKDLFAADIRDVQGEAIPDAEIDDLYEELLLEVELVQLEQMALLRCLIKHHGLKSVFCEGLTVEDLPAYEAKIKTLRKFESVTRKLEELSESLARGGDDDLASNQLLRQIDEASRELRLLLLQIGAVGRLYLAGELEEVLPVDDAKLLKEANPLATDGKITLDVKVIEARQDAQVQAMIDHGPFALCILGAAHDLADNVERLAGGRCELIVVETARVEEFSAKSDE